MSRKVQASEIKPEKECEICGIWYTPSRKNQKYCPDCRNHSDQKKRNMNENIRISIAKYGTGRPPEKIENVCKYCGKEYITYGRSKPFCSDKCRVNYHIENTYCCNCGKPMLETDDQRDMNGHNWCCSEKCKAEWEWKTARRNGFIGTCLECGKEFINRKNKTFCSVPCYRNFVKSGKKIVKPITYVERKCNVCGKIFSCEADKSFMSYCSEQCHEKYLKMESEIRIRNKKELEQKQQELAEAKERKYIEENGLCSMCRTSYKDCERMQSNFRYSPKGTVFKGAVVIKCPKYSCRKTGSGKSNN